MRLSGRVLMVLGMVAVVCGACPQDRTRVLFSQMFVGTAARYCDVGELDASVGGGIQQWADNFTYPSPLAAINRIKWWGGHTVDQDAVDNFTIRFYSESATPGIPQSLPIEEIVVGSVSRRATGATFGEGGSSWPLYEYTASILPYTLQPETTYYISILNDTGDWAWEACDDDDIGDHVIWLRNALGGDWAGVADIDLSFELLSVQ